MSNEACSDKDNPDFPNWDQAFDIYTLPTDGITDHPIQPMSESLPPPVFVPDLHKLIEDDRLYMLNHRLERVREEYTTEKAKPINLFLLIERRNRLRSIKSMEILLEDLIDFNTTDSSSEDRPN